MATRKTAEQKVKELFPNAVQDDHGWILFNGEGIAEPDFYRWQGRTITSWTAAWNRLQKEGLVTK